MAWTCWNGERLAGDGGRARPKTEIGTSQKGKRVWWKWREACREN